MTTKGEITGLEATLRDYLTHFQPEDLTRIFGSFITLPLPEWHEWSYFQAGTTASISAASSSRVALWTCPLNERVWLESARLVRASGDNTALVMTTNFPADYSDGGQEMGLIRLSAGSPDLFWPDPGGAQTIVYQGPAGPLLLEPGSDIGFYPGGDGVAASTFDFNICTRRQKTVRALVPLA